jgi:hypothetical protein
MNSFVWIGRIALVCVGLWMLTAFLGIVARGNPAAHPENEQVIRHFDKRLLDQGHSFATRPDGGGGVVLIVGDGWFDLSHGTRRRGAEEWVELWLDAYRDASIPYDRAGDLTIEASGRGPVARWTHAAGLLVDL